MALSWSKFARNSLAGFVIGISSCAGARSFPIFSNVFLSSLAYLASEVLVLRIVYFGTKYSELWKATSISAALGVTFGSGVHLALTSSQLQGLGLYLCFLSFFHWSEYLTTAVTNEKTLCLQSFLLDHSREYVLAALLSWAEFGLEACFVAEMKQQKYLILAGFIMTLGGEMLRKGAMWTAKANFNHHVQYVKQSDHELVTHGLYAWFRHPSYVGWFFWSIGTQVLLANPVCLVAYAIASWRFFNDRIQEEEMTLVHFFGHPYLAYQRRVPIGIPFIRGFRVGKLK